MQIKQTKRKTKTACTQSNQSKEEVETNRTKHTQ